MRQGWQLSWVVQLGAESAGSGGVGAVCRLDTAVRMGLPETSERQPVGVWEGESLGRVQCACGAKKGCSWCVGETEASLAGWEPFMQARVRILPFSVS